MAAVISKGRVVITVLTPAWVLVAVMIRVAAMAPGMTAAPASAWAAIAVTGVIHHVAAMAPAPGMTAAPASAWAAVARPEEQAFGLFATYNKAALINAALFFISDHFQATRALRYLIIRHVITRIFQYIYLNQVAGLL
jgi:hypothetical protein